MLIAFIHTYTCPCGNTDQMIDAPGATPASVAAHMRAAARTGGQP